MEQWQSDVESVYEHFLSRQGIGVPAGLLVAGKNMGQEWKSFSWSTPAFWSMGLLNEQEWKAQWIGAPWQGEEALPKPPRRGPGQPAPTAKALPPPAPMLRKSFTIQKKVSSARAFVT